MKPGKEVFIVHPELYQPVKPDEKDNQRDQYA
jgi:hypothetical protein